jgi:hypothetical protein
VIDDRILKAATEAYDDEHRARSRALHSPSDCHNWALEAAVEATLTKAAEIRRAEAPAVPPIAGGDDIEFEEGEGDGTCRRCGPCCTMVQVDCGACGGDGTAGSACIDDMCHGQDECIHGDRAMLKCAVCEGRGGWMTCGGACCAHGRHEQGDNCTEQCPGERRRLDDP